MAFVLDTVLLLSLLLWVLRAGQAEALSPTHTAFILVTLTALVATARAWGMSLARLVFRIGVPLASLAMFLVWNTDGSQEQMIGLLFALLPVLIAMVGLYVMIRGSLRLRPRR